ncbi:glycosyltransferase family 4 protein [Intrasporangium sp. YIM S08009]|uniref:glycosyltransferase family 4 protein n=1 Tax=Intrasporangium zincisolvens TaxID=3080018 RepID=UPI002B05A5C8|nr:glycosyltransferase family 4 protein [Intrasporangium sp. YIM S08009]
MPGRPAPDATGGRRQPLRVAALFVSDWGHEFRDVAAGRVPSHRLFGMAELAARGHDVRHLTRRRRWLRLPRALEWRAAQATWLLREQRRLDVVVATHEAAALPALLLRRLGLLRRPVVVLTVAALEATSRPGRAGRVQRLALAGADAVTVFASAQVEPLARRLGLAPGRVRAVPLGVDTAWFRPREDHRDGGVLSVGTNGGKDYPTLVRALGSGVSCTVVTDPWNREQAAAALAQLDAGQRPDVEFRADVPIGVLRDLYARAEVVALPLRESAVSSGQTVLLENLATGTPVVVSDVSGIADYVDASVVRLVPPGDPAALRAALTDASWRDRAAGGPAHVAASFTTDHLAAAVEAALRDILATGADWP